MLYDVNEESVKFALESIRSELFQFEQEGILRGTLSAQNQSELIRGASSLAECVRGAVYIQECVPEILDLKIKVWKEIDGLVDNTTILASSTSCIVPSEISKDLTNRQRFIVAHPCNPPYHTPMVELVPAPWTDDNTRQKTRDIMKAAKQGPVSLTREKPGFVLNRLQYALLNECVRLIEEKVVSPQDLDVVMKDGMGMRYAFMGPMETIHLNAEGTKKYCDVYGKTIFNVSSDSGPIPTAWRQDSEADVAVVDFMHEAMCTTVPLEKLNERRLWRDKRLAALAKLKREMDETE